MNRSIRAARRTALAPLLSMLGVVACGSEQPQLSSGDPAPAVAPTAIVPGVPLQGELVTYILTGEDGSTDYQHYLRFAGEVERRLHFDAPPDLAGGTQLRVWPRGAAGVAQDEILVDRFDALDTASAGGAVETRQSNLINAPALKPRRLAFVLVDLGNGVNLTKAQATQRVFGVATNDGSLRQYYNEVSYGRQDLGGDVIGPLRATMSGCNFQQVSQQLRSMIEGQYDHYLWYFGQRVGACPFAGVAVSGSAARPVRDSWYNGSSGCVVLVQEPGHNFGMMHSSAMRCQGGSGLVPFADTPMGNCQHSEYGDPYDPMGRACRHMNGYQKAYQGWFGKCNMVDITSSGTFTLNPIEVPCDGVQVLQIKMPKSRPFMRSGGGGQAGITTLTHYYVEMRAPLGFDRMIAPTVQVRVSGDIRMSNQSGLHTWVLDMNPATTNAIEGLAAGASFSDPAGGITIRVEALDNTKATVRVEIPGGSGGPMCMDGTPLTGSGPGPESCAPALAVPPGAAPTFPDGGSTPGQDGGTIDARPADTGGAGGGGGIIAADAGPQGGSAGGQAGGSGAGGSNGSSAGTSGNAGSAGARGGAGGAAGSAGGAGSGNGGGSVEERPEAVAGGCGCTVGGHDRGGLASGLLVGLVGALLLSRRRRHGRAHAAQ